MVAIYVTIYYSFSWLLLVESSSDFESFYFFKKKKKLFDVRKKN